MLREFSNVTENKTARIDSRRENKAQFSIHTKQIQFIEMHGTQHTLLVRFVLCVWLGKASSVGLMRVFTYAVWL